MSHFGEPFASSTDGNPPGAVATVEYAPVRPPRWGWRRVMAAGVLIALSVAAWRHGPGLWRRTAGWYAVRQCGAYTLPPRTVVYDDDPASMGKLLGSPDYAAVGAGIRGIRAVPRGPAVLRSDPPCFQSLAAVVRRPEMMWGNGGASWRAEPLLFLHARKSPSGKERLVLVRGSVGPPIKTAATRIAVAFGGAVVEPRGWDVPAAKWGVSLIGQLVVPEPSAHPPQVSARFFAGQPDPKDESALVLPYELNGVRGEVVARLVDRPGGPQLVFEGVQ